jgi:protein SCO1/2
MKSPIHRGGTESTEIYPEKTKKPSPRFPRFLRVSAVKSIFALTVTATAFAQPGQPAPAQPSYSLQDGNLKPVLPGALQGVGIDQKLNAQVPLDLVFHDEAGRDVRLSSFFQTKKPVILVPVYYRCPMLCTQILTGVESSLKAVSLNPGRDFEVVSFSIDPKDTPETAASKKELYLRRYGRPGTANGWHFLTGDESNIKALADSVGFHFKYDPKTDQFAHASGIMVLTPDGHTSKYFYGVEYAPRDLRLGLVEASQDKIGNPVDQILLFCYHYDPATGKYGAMAINMVRAAGAGFAIAGGTVLLFVFRRDIRRGRRGTRII